MGINVAANTLPLGGDNLRSLRYMKVMAATAALVLSTSSFASDWTFVPSIAVNETYTDNVSLVQSSLAKSDYMTEVLPSFTLTNSGHYFDFSTIYTLQEIEYAKKSTAAALDQQVSATARAELIENFLYLKGSGSVGQQNISALGPQPINNIYATDNRTNVRTYNISPYLSHTFDSYVTSDLGYSFATTAANAGGLATDKADTVFFDIKSGLAFNSLGWGVQYNGQTIHYPGLENVVLRTTSGNLDYLIVPEFKLTATAGYDQNDYATLGGVTRGAFWTTGFGYAPTGAYNLSASVGHRYFGDTASISAVARTRTSIWNLSYNESVTTTQAQFGLPATIDTANTLNQLSSATISDPVQRTQAVNNIIQQVGLPPSLANQSNFFTNSVFLQKQLQGSVVLKGRNSMLVISVYNTQQIPLSSQYDVDILEKSAATKQLGLSAVLSRQLSTYSSLNVTLLATRISSIPIGAPSDIVHNQSLKFDLTTRLSPKVSAVFELRRDQEESDLPGIEYRENAIAAFFNFQL